MVRPPQSQAGTVNGHAASVAFVGSGRTAGFRSLLRSTRRRARFWPALKILISGDLKDYGAEGEETFDGNEKLEKASSREEIVAKL
jgi:hypothetical protein